MVITEGWRGGVGDEECATPWPLSPCDTSKCIIYLSYWIVGSDKAREAAAAPLSARLLPPVIYKI